MFCFGRLSKLTVFVRPGGQLLQPSPSVTAQKITSGIIRTMSETTKKHVDIADMRAPYRSSDGILDESHLSSKEPVSQFKCWFDEACQAGVHEPNAMALATSDSSGKPSVRMVLLKGFDEKGFQFFTNYTSRKGEDLKSNPCCSLLFYWHELKRQVRIEGIAEQLSVEESTTYFQRRPHSSQIGACISNQSSPVASREVLETLYDDMLKKHPEENGPVPKPDYWGGYLVKPTSIEFWQGQTNRVHDRILFRKPRQGEVTDPEITKEGDNGWVFERLSP